MKKKEKVTLVDSLTEEIKKAKAVVLVNFVGMNVASQQELKKRLKESNSRMTVIKNTLLKRAGEKAGIDTNALNETILSGQTALVISDEDPVAPIQVLGKFTKEFETPKMKVGIVEGMFQDEVALTRLSTLPGKDALLGQVLGSLMASSYGLVGTLQANMQKLIYILQEKSKQG